MCHEIHRKSRKYRLPTFTCRYCAEKWIIEQRAMMKLWIKFQFPAGHAYLWVKGPIYQFPF
jgi:hypothetical protein